MNGRGSCCIARHAGGGAGMYGMSKVEMIMLKYRPIAPKPVATGSGSGGSTTENSDGYVKCRRGKRKYVKKKGNNNNNNNSKVCKKVTTTLSLLPESPDRRENYSDLLSPANINKSSEPAPVWLTFDNVCYGDGHVSYGTPPQPHPIFPAPRGRQEVVSYVTVECVRETTWVDGELGMGCTDEERVMKMEMDTCPGFISDREDRVVWSNKAFREMVGVGGGEMTVVLVRKDNWTLSPETIYPSFTCKVRVSAAAAGTLPASPTRTLPCDVWRMDCGGCAWRLDVYAALSLGR